MKYESDKCASLLIKQGKIHLYPSLGEIMPLEEFINTYIGLFESNVFDITEMKTLLQQ